MASPLPSRYPLDLTGQSVNNLVVDEVHPLSIKKIRTVAPKYGPYFTESIVVTDAATNLTLTKGFDYRCIDIVGIPTAQSGKEICTIIVITNESISGNVRITYQALGGGYERAYDSIATLIDNLTHDNRPVTWPNIINRPPTFDPTMHLHALGDVIGFEYVVSALESLKTAVMLGDDVGHDEILQYIDSNIDALITLVNDSESTTIALAMARAQAANAAATNALLDAQQNQADLGALEALVNTAYSDTLSLKENYEDTQSLAESLLTRYPILFATQFTTAMNTRMPSGIEQVHQFPVAQAIGFISTDVYSIDKNGRVIIGVASETTPTPVSDLVFSIRMSTYKETITGNARIDVQINTYDHRASNLTGAFTQNCELVLYPVQFQSGNEELIPTFCHSCQYTATENPADGTIRGMAYGIVGVDTAANIGLTGSSAIISAAATKISQYLFDCRADYNIAGYGMVDRRRAVKLVLPQGCELGFSFKISGIDVSEIQKNVTLPFKQYQRISKSTLVGGVLTTTDVKTGPDSSSIRSLGCYF